MKVAVPFTKNILAPLGIADAASAIDVGIQKKLHGSGITTLKISNEEMNDIMKIVQAFEDLNILLKRVNKTIKNETKEQKEGFLGMLLGTLGSSLLRNMLAEKGIAKAGYGNKKEKEMLRQSFGSKKTLKFKNIIKMNPDLMEFIQEIS